MVILIVILRLVVKIIIIIVVRLIVIGIIRLIVIIVQLNHDLMVQTGTNEHKSLLSH